MLMYKSISICFILAISISLSSIPIPDIINDGDLQLLKNTTEENDSMLETRNELGLTTMICGGFLVQVDGITLNMFAPESKGDHFRYKKNI